MYSGEAAIYRMFAGLRHDKIPLGVAEYRDAVKILRSGDWIGDLDPAADRERLKRRLGLLWTKSAEDKKRFEEWFDREFNLFAEASPPTEADAGEGGWDSCPDSVGVGLSQTVSGRPGETSEAAPPPLAHDFPDLGQRTFLMTPHYPVSRRRMSGAFRRLRLMKRDGPLRELDIAGTIKQICRCGCLRHPLFQRARRNQTDLLLLLDRHGSMDPFAPMIKALVAGVLHSGLLRHVQAWYFQNIPRAVLYQRPELTAPVTLDTVLSQDLTHYHALIVSDAGAARGYDNEERKQETRKFLERLKLRVYRYAWLNPVPAERWPATTAESIAALAPMFPLDQEGLLDAVNTLQGQGPQRTLRRLR